MDGRGISDEDYDYMMHWLVHEGIVALVNHMKEEGIDFRKNPIEFGTYHIFIEGKTWINEKAETSVRGLYASGDESMGSIGPAATYGWIAGENAARYAKEKSAPEVEKARREIEARKNLVHEIRSRKEGSDWKEANIALQQIMQDYAGVIRSETLLQAGLGHLRRLKKKVGATTMAGNQWELTRCLETRNLLDLGELVFISADERKETRGLHKRTDYPLTDPLLDNKALFIKKVDEKPVTEWRKLE